MKHTEYFDGVIHTWDNVFSDTDLDTFCEEIAREKYEYGTGDAAYNNKIIPTGLTTMGRDLSYTKWFSALKKFCDNIGFLNDYQLLRHHLNIFAPGENARYHSDIPGDSWTLIFYANAYWNVNDFGETKFQIFPKEIKTAGIKTECPEYPVILSIAPLPGRICVFRGNLQHSATAFRDEHRFTASLQYGKKYD